MMTIIKKYSMTALKFLAICVTVVCLLELTLQLVSVFVKHAYDERSACKGDNCREGAFRILTLGDSNTYGLYVEKDEAWPMQLQQLLERSDYPVSVLNLGWPGTNSTTVNWQIEELINSFHPNLILVMVGFNDVWTTPIYDEDMLWWETVKYKSRVWKQVLLIYSRFFDEEVALNIDAGDRYAYRKNLSAEQEDKIGKELSEQLKTGRLQSLLRGLKVEDNIFYLGINAKIINHDNIFDPRQHGYKNSVYYSVDHIAKKTALHKIPVVFLSYGSPKENGYALANQNVFGATEQYHVPNIDVRVDARYKCEEITCEGSLFTDRHPTAKGYSYIAETVFNFLKSNNYLPEQTRH